MKKEPIIYFPNSDEAPERKQVSVGKVLRIGKPSRRYYEYVHHSLNYNSHRLKDLEALLELEGTAVKVISILKMKTGSKIAVLHKNSGENFSENVDKLFASLDQALDANELNIF